MRLTLLCLLLIPACTPDIQMPAPAEMAVKQVGYGPAAAVELSWRVVIRAGGYLVEYGEASGDRLGAGLSVVRWPEGCGDFDGGAPLTPADSGAGAGSADAGWPGYSAKSPIRVPAFWCLERTHTYTDAGFQPAATPASRPRLRLNGLLPGKTYYFTVRSFRLASTSEASGEVSITPVKGKTP